MVANVRQVTYPSEKQTGHEGGRETERMKGLRGRTEKEREERGTESEEMISRCLNVLT